jgi:hypothetical protein
LLQKDRKEFRCYTLKATPLDEEPRGSGRDEPGLAPK